tara:strand:+ start:5320 stop:5661 length:342 start_codon:yes stop_codon:yes gene_type:complete
MEYNYVEWNRMITGPSYYDDDNNEQYPVAEILVDRHHWVVRMEGREIYWRYRNNLMGNFTFTPKSWTDSGTEFPIEWPMWLQFEAISRTWGLRNTRKVDANQTSLKHWWERND